MLKKFIVRIMIFLLVLGCVRLSLGYTEFVPSYNSLVDRFASMPDIPRLYLNDFNAINNAFSTLTNGFNNITNLGSFFTAIGNVFSLMWTITELIADTFLIPIQWLIWCFTTLFGF